LPIYDRHRVQVDDLREQHGYQHVAVENLDHEVGHGDVQELGAPAPLKPGDQVDRDGHHGGPDVGNEHRQPDQEAEQHGVVEAEVREGDEAHAPDDEDLPELAADVVGDLGVDVLPDLLRQLVVARQVAQQPGQDAVLVLHEEEHQDRHQHEVQQDADQPAHGSQRQGQHPLPEQRQLAAQHGDDLVDLLRRDDLGVALRQTHHHFLAARQERRHLLHELGELARQQRNQPQHDEDQGQHEHGEHQHHGQQPRHLVPFHDLDDALEQVGDDDAGDDRAEDVAEHQHHREHGDKHHREENDLRVGEVPLEPVGDEVHARLGGRRFGEFEVVGDVHRLAQHDRGRAVLLGGQGDRARDAIGGQSPAADDEMDVDLREHPGRVRGALGRQLDPAVDDVLAALAQDMDHVEGGAAAEAHQEQLHGPRAAVLPAVFGSAVDHDRVAAVGHRLETHAVFERNRCFHLASPDGLPADRAAGGGCIIPRKTGAPALLPGPSPA